MRSIWVGLCAVAAGSITTASLVVGDGAPSGAQTAPAPPPAGGGQRGIGPGLDNQVAQGADFSPKPPVAHLSPAEQQKHFLLPPGYKIELVLADPLIEDPVGVTFDGNGRMYVLEMRSYMQDVDGTNSRAPISRISRHEDTDGDGTYDRSTVFADKLVMPRIAFPLEDGVILAFEQGK
jgi:glucose/arabinose dehydrogenase